jgi:hypothetical protein
LNWFRWSEHLRESRSVHPLSAKRAVEVLAILPKQMTVRAIPAESKPMVSVSDDLTIENAGRYCKTTAQR